VDEETSTVVSSSSRHPNHHTTHSSYIIGDEEQEQQDEQRTTTTSSSMTLKHRVRSLLHEAVLINQYLDQATASLFSKKRRRTSRGQGSTVTTTRGGPSERPTTTTTTTTTTAAGASTTTADEEEYAKNKSNEDDTASSSSNEDSSSIRPPSVVIELGKEEESEEADEAALMVISHRLDEFDRRVRLIVPEIDHRHVPWGGTIPWYSRDLLRKYYNASMDMRKDEKMTTAPSSADDAVSSSKNRTTDWWATNVHFPRTRCLQQQKKRRGGATTPTSTTSTSSTTGGGGGCRIEESILYTLRWREVYQPWRVTPSMQRQNQGGFIYANGVTTTHNRNPEGQLQQHGIVWYRPSRVNAVGGASGAAGSSPQQIDPVSYFRCALHTIERAIAPTGTFVAVVDAADFGWHQVPYPMHYWARQTITMLKDHYPHRLGCIVLVNMSPMTELVLQLLRPWLPVRVRGLLRSVKSQSELANYLGQEALDEDDRYIFQAKQYYEPAQFHMSDEEGETYLEFIESA
jgi:CRAL/TRIO domain